MSGLSGNLLPVFTGECSSSPPCYRFGITSIAFSKLAPGWLGVLRMCNCTTTAATTTILSHYGYVMHCRVIH